ncbi:ABC transporter ATP-binding protein [Anaerosinus massiliensis]|uniref:ABC transporter ATP-binding protein n=1 Tax=Massilibacillus massiliensis TaxID=1806837 RepID=UPI000AD84481|nr:ATP-binding cassette domain-containing protein [Massilibacillus massiliensis]
MGLLRVSGLSKAFGIEELFHDVSFDVSGGDKVGFIGANGTGKSTLMRCLMGLEEVDKGQIHLSETDTIGYVEQEASLGDWTLREELSRAFADVLNWQDEMKVLEEKIAAEKDKTVVEALMKMYAAVVDKFERAGGYDYESTIRKVAFGLGFHEADFDQPVRHFSGGQQTRICLAKALIRQPDFLFLDEPTNHLDIEMVEWLEEFLIGYSGGVLIISHDRFFLDRVANQVIELENKTVTVYSGNYSRFTKVKAQRLAALESAYEKQQVHIQKTEEYIRRYKAGIKSKQARGREKQLNRLERVVLPPNSVGFNFFSFNPPSECAQRVAELEEVAVSYGSHEIFRDLSLLVRNGDGVALVGPNGAGKTTLLKLLVGELEGSSGKIKLGSRVKLGYFSQQHEGLNLGNRLLDELMYAYDLTEERARHYLGAFLFQGDEVYKIIGELSGGEKSRLAFLKLMLTGANFLVLDEPTNHLDIPAKEAVEEALMAFPGTFITVSHDRYFLDKVTNCTYELANGKLTEYNGSYSYYHAKKLELKKEAAEVEKEQGKNAVEKSQPQRKIKSREVKPQDRAKLAQKYEGEIAMLELELKGIEFQLNDPASHADAMQSQTLASDYDRVSKELAEKYDLWAHYSEDIE